jgi:hypothetical protein
MPHCRYPATTASPFPTMVIYPNKRIGTSTFIN